MAEDTGASSEEFLSLDLMENNKKFFKFFKLLGLFPITFKKGKFKVDEKVCVITRIVWFLWNLFGIISILYIRWRIHDHCHQMKNETNNSSRAQNTRNDCSEDLGDLNIYLIGCIGILLFILVDPIQTIILKRNSNFLPKILEEIKLLENINLGKRLSRYKPSKVSIIFNQTDVVLELKPTKKVSTGGFTNRGFSVSSDTSINSPQNDEISESSSPENINIPASGLNDDKHSEREKKFSRCYNTLRYIILGLSILTFLVMFWYGLVASLKPQPNDKRHDIVDEWKFVLSLFYLIFPVITTWFCVFFIGFQRQMYKVINQLPNDQFCDEELIKDIGIYFESMQKISKMLIDKVYRFTFGINFALFVIIGTMSTFELMQGLGEIRQFKRKNFTEFADIIYLFPIAVCVFHIFISCQRSTSLIMGQHDKLRYKLKGILTSLLVDRIEISKENEKKFKRVELLYKNIKDFNPQAEVYGGIKVNYSLFTGMLIFIFTYSRIFYGYIGIPIEGQMV